MNWFISKVNRGALGTISWRPLKHIDFIARKPPTVTLKNRASQESGQIRELMNALRTESRD